MAASPTLKELACLLNLAPSTVSKALRGHSDISKLTQERVKTLARRLQYRPSEVAIGLRNRHFSLVAVIIPKLTDYFYAAALQGIVESAYEKGYKVLVFESKEQYKREVEICLSLQKAGIDGLLLSPAKTTVDSLHLRELIEMSLPVVFFDRMLGNMEADRVMEDDYYGACIAVNTLIESGCRRIAHLSASQQWLWAQKRQMGYVQALLDHHLSVDREMIVEINNQNKVEEVVVRLIQDFQIDAIFAVDDESAEKALSFLHRSGYRVPEDIAVCGYGDYPFAAMTCPALTTIARNGYRVGKEAIDILIRRIEKKLLGESEIKLLKSDLVIRESIRRLDINK